MTSLRTSVIVVSRHRPQALARCLTGLGQLDHPDFEVIVVADPDSLAAVAPERVAPGGLRIRPLPFDAANISAARNLGLSLAAAPVIAFIDDDAVPEPTWLCRLSAPFADPRVLAATGYVRGRNGISFQWTASACLPDGGRACLSLSDPAQGMGRVHLLPPPPATADGQGAIHTEGTNCAFRRETLLALGGFDPGFHFYLDETDLNMRMAHLGGLTAIVPDAQVHHGFAASGRRQADRAPRSLVDIGASSMLFWRKHLPPARLEPVLQALRHAQRTRLIGHMLSGGLEPGEVTRLMAGLDAGLATGRTRSTGALPPMIGADPAGFCPARPADTPAPRPRRVIAGPIWQLARLRRKARASVDQGAITTLFVFGPSRRRHRHIFNAHGFWEQNGGVWGRSDRQAKAPALTTSLADRVRIERARLAPLRDPVSPVPDDPAMK